MSGEMVVVLTVNGEDHHLSIPPTRLLLDALREDLQLTGTKCACSQGICGSCTVLLDGEPIRSCLSLAINSTGYAITTVEGLADGDEPSFVQQAFLDAGAIQCGFCMPGFILTATAFLKENPAPNDEEIRHAISGNLCRCSGYVKVVDAIRLASRTSSGEAGG
jgi:aerobic carbon-monoxide dehydrogenase small subunit